MRFTIFSPHTLLMSTSSVVESATPVKLLMFTDGAPLVNRRAGVNNRRGVGAGVSREGNTGLVADVVVLSRNARRLVADLGVRGSGGGPALRWVGEAIGVA